MPANKHASVYLNGAYERMLAAIQKIEPPSFDICPAADQFEEAKKHALDLGEALDDYLHSLAREASSNASSHISTKDKMSLVSDALHDSGLLGELQGEADDLRQRDESKSDRSEHSTHYYAYSGAR